MQLNLSQLGLVFDKVRQDSSVEALIVFMARAFMRQAAWARSQELQSGALYDPLVRDADDDDKEMWLGVLYGDAAVSQYAQSQKARVVLDATIGGPYWQSIVDDKSVDWEEKVARLVDLYRGKLRCWFRSVEALPVRPDMSPIPKYWIAFMSRYEPAFDLFNRAACQMVRSRDLNMKSGPRTLFAGMPVEPDTPSPASVDRAVKRTAQRVGSTTWRELRWRTCGERNVGKFTDSEVDQSIKRLLKAGWLTGTSGAKTEDTTILHPTEQLRLWQER